jgi:hypothetical protein
MARPTALFEISSAEELPTEATLQIGDLIYVNATGVSAIDQSGVVETLGPFTTGVLSSSGPVVPIGDPNVVLIVARREGTAELRIVFGSAWGPHQTRKITIHVERSSQ